MRLHPRLFSYALALAALSACGTPAAAPAPTVAPSGPTATPFLRDSSHLFDAQPTAAAEESPTAAAPVDSAAQPQPTVAAVAAEPIVVQTTGKATPIDPRLLGTNLPAWLGPKRLADPKLHARTKASGVSVIRLPGGTWSNHYDWLACEQQQPACAWDFAARPSDMLAFLKASGAQGMWTVSANSTAQEAAALVAFANGEVGDTRTIGVDVQGRDWKTVGDWATLRSAGGNPEPAEIKLWEFGNELYGGKQGKDCTSAGWEDVWTCDGSEYVQGTGSGKSRHEGYLEVRAAMLAIDPTIKVGAVGNESLDNWSNWGREVIKAAGSKLDFYIVHHYGYNQPPTDTSDVARQPLSTWPLLAQSLGEQLGDTPIAVTEYNIVAFQDGDGGQLMRRAVNLFYTVDTIGQLAESGVAIANHWDLMNGQADNGTDYGLLHADTLARQPAYYAFPLWSRMGQELLPVSAGEGQGGLHAYASRAEDGTIAVLVVNPTAQALAAPLQLDGDPSPRTASADVVQASSLSATEASFNGVADPADDLSDAPSAALGQASGSLDTTFPPFSVTLVRLVPAS